MRGEGRRKSFLESDLYIGEVSWTSWPQTFKDRADSEERHEP